MNVIRKQLDVFEDPVTYSKVGSHFKMPLLPYDELDINQKINAKADSNFPIILLRTMLPWAGDNGVYLMRHVCYWKLSDRWFWQVKANKKSIETICWRKGLIGSQNKIKI